jgi:hypothetical protein
LFEKMLDAACTATQVIEKEVAHKTPAQAGSPAQCGIYIGGADDAFGNKVVNFPGKGGLQTIGDVPWHLLAYSDRPPAYDLIEFREATGADTGAINRYPRLGIVSMKSEFFGRSPSALRTVRTCLFTACGSMTLLGHTASSSSSCVTRRPAWSIR